MKKESIGQSHEPPDFFVRLSKLLGSAAECQRFFAALEKLSKNKSRALRLNPLKLNSREQFREFELKDAVKWAPEHFLLDNGVFESLKKRPHIAAGLAYIQDPAALEAPMLLNPLPHENILDLCAAPGGKATFIGELLAHQGFLLCNDVDARRAMTLAQLTARQGLREVAVTSEKVEKLCEVYQASFDAVLLDAPCSGESFFAKRKEWRRDVSDHEVNRLSFIQKQLLNTAATALRVGGRIVYSTCTYSAEENEDVVEDFLLKHRYFKKIKELRRWPHIDEVPGGYTVLLQDERMADAANDIQKHSDIKYLRWRNEASDASLNLYIQAMCGTADWPRVDVDEVQAMKYLRGESLPRPSQVSSSHLIVSWRNYPLGPAKAVENRLNNLLPKALRIL